MPLTLRENLDRPLTTEEMDDNFKILDAQSKAAGKVDKVAGVAPDTEKNIPADGLKQALALDKVDNTRDIDKPVSTPQAEALAQKASVQALTDGLAQKANAQATTNALADKVDKVAGKGLSANDLTNERAQKLDSVQAQAQKNPDLVTIAEAQAGVEAGLRSWSPVRIHNAIAGWYTATIKSVIDGLKQGSRMDVAGLNERNSGLLLQTGAGGWMGDVPVGINNIDDKTVRGWRYVVEATAGTKPPGVSYGHVLTFGNTNDAVNQEFWEISGTAGVTLRKFMRTTFGTGPWGPWVSLTGETGGNANGTYWKLPNGLLICRYNATLEAGGALKNLDWTFPAQFAGKPYVDVQSEQGQGSDPSLFSRTLTYQYLTGSMARIQYKSPSQVTGVLIAIGVAA